MPLFAFLLIGGGLTLAYSGYLGIQPTELFRDLTTGTPVPKRRGALTKPASPAGPAPKVYQPYIQHPSAAPQPQTPQISGTTGGIPA